MHWVLVYFLSQGNVGGVGQIRFKTAKECNQFYYHMYLGYQKQSVHVKGLCMKWPDGSLYTE